LKVAFLAVDVTSTNLNAISDPADPDNSTTKSNVTVPSTEYPL
jgi:hypothetical protein